MRSAGLAATLGFDLTEPERSPVSINQNSLNRRRFACAAAGLAAAALAIPVWAQPRFQKTKISVSAVDKASFFHLPLTLAAQLGYFEAEGLSVEIMDSFGDARALQASPGGGVDLVSGAYENTIELQAMGQHFQAFVLQSRTPAIAVGIAPKAIPNFKSVTDLRGKRIGVAALGSATHRAVASLLARAGLPAGSVDYVAVGNSAQALAAFRSGQIDALSSVDPVLTVLEQKSEIRIIADTRTLKGTVAVFGAVMPGACLYASLDFIQKNRATVQAVTDAMVRALRWLQTAGPGDILKAVPETYLLGDRGLYLAAFNKLRMSISTDGLIPDEGSRNTARVLASFDAALRLDKIDLAKTYTNEFVKKSKERFKV